jgi:hypothetical protein
MGYALRLLAIIMFSTLSESAFAREKGLTALHINKAPARIHISIKEHI